MKPRARLLVLTVAALIAVAGTLSLGLWQLGRAQQKLELQAAADARSASPLIDTAALYSAADPTQLLYGRVHIRGTWVPGATVFLDNRQMDARVGFYVMTPLLPEGGGAAILVQRGWLPRNFVNRDHLPMVETATGVVALDGLIVPPPSKLYELGSAATGVIRQNLDLSQFGMELRLPLLSVTLQQTGTPGDGLLRRWPAPNLGIGKHYGYAFQWFALAALMTALYLWFQIVRPFLKRSKDPASHV